MQKFLLHRGETNGSVLCLIAVASFVTIGWYWLAAFCCTAAIAFNTWRRSLDDLKEGE